MYRQLKAVIRLRNLFYPLLVLCAMTHIYFKYTAYLHSSNNSSVPIIEVVPIKVRKTVKWKSIVWYKLYHGGLRMNANAVDMNQCEFKYCTINFIDNAEHERTYFPTADAVIFQGGRLPYTAPKRHHANQAYIFGTVESPIHLAHSLGGRSWWKQFNWTMTYRTDSDISYKYGAVHKKNESSQNQLSQKEYAEIFQRKTKDIAWLVSDCKTESLREKYVNILQKYVNVDIYGRCGSFKNCTKSEGIQCMADIANEYKFYLSFENSVCRDYMTEKVFVWFQMNIINVVRGAMTYKNVLPPNTYINAHDFDSIEKLAKHLKQLGNNQQEYVKYLQEKAKYDTDSLQSQFQGAYCELCKRLHNLDDYKKVYSNVNNWWYQRTCKRHVMDLH